MCTERPKGTGEEKKKNEIEHKFGASIAQNINQFYEISRSENINIREHLLYRKTYRLFAYTFCTLREQIYRSPVYPKTIPYVYYPFRILSRINRL